LREFITDEIQPEALSLPMVEYMMDEGLWEWVNNADPDNLLFSDFESAYWAVISLKELYDNDMIMAVENES